MNISCIIHNQKTEHTGIVVVKIPNHNKKKGDDMFDHIQNRLGKDELLLDYYRGGVEFRNLEDLPKIKRQWIVQVVSNYYGIPASEFTHNDPERRPRKTIKVKCRAMCYHFMMQYSDMRLREIGSYFKKRHHSSVINGLKQYKSWIETDEVFAIECHEIQKQIVSKVQ